ncbi:CAP domain-containing protein [Azospirillum rugosum]|nr:uncharacterized protein YkwD [Azospirillum rugosum]
MATPTAYEQYMLELINRARANPAAEAARQGIDLNQGLTAGTISTAAKAALAWDPALIDAARAHSQWMLDTDTFSHTGINGSSPGARMTDAGYGFSGSWTWGENIAIRWGSGTSINASTVEAMESGLFKSAGHRTNILNDSFREIGVGLKTGEYQGSTGMTGTQDFAKTAGNPFLTGVTFDDKDGDNFYDPGEGIGGVTIKAVSATGTTYQTTSWDAGGYQMDLPTGTYTVSFSGAGLPSTITKTATIGTSNVKLDVNQDVAAPTSTLPPPMELPATTAATIVVNASGTAAGGVNAHFNLLMDGKKIGEGVAGTTAKDFTFNATVLPDTAHRVQIQYDNDALINGQDRTLFVNKVTINGHAVSPTDSIVTYDKGALDGKDVVKGQPGMWWNGALVVTADKSFFPGSAVKGVYASAEHPEPTGDVDVWGHVATAQGHATPTLPDAATQHLPFGDHDLAWLPDHLPYGYQPDLDHTHAG